MSLSWGWGAYARDKIPQQEFAVKKNAGGAYARGVASLTCETLRYYLYKISTAVIAYTVASLYTTSTETYLGTGEV